MEKYVIPLAGCKVRMPGSYAIIPPDGVMIDLSGKDGRYIRRRINDGSLISYDSRPIAKKEEIKNTIKTEFKKGEN